MRPPGAILSPGESLIATGNGFCITLCDSVHFPLFYSVGNGIALLYGLLFFVNGIMSLIKLEVPSFLFG